MSKPSFLAELKRRHVYKVGATYAVAGWLLAQVVTQVLPVFNVSLLGQRILVLILIAGFPVALVLAWLFDITPEGIVLTEHLPSDGEPQAAIRARRSMDRKLNYLLGALVLLGGGYFAAERMGFVGRDQTAVSDVAAGGKSIAVLPFENLSEDKANAYFAVGIQDEILTQLAKLGDLRVISRTSTRQYSSRPDSLPEIAKQLGVENVLEGSVQKSGNSVHVNVQLIRATTDEHLWAETYDRKLDDVFGVQNEIAGAVAAQLDAKLTGGERHSLAAVPTRNPEAYDAYLRALAVQQRPDSSNSDNSLASIELLRKATQIDPDFADAWAELSGLYLSRYTGRGEGERLKQAQDAAEAALRLQPDSAKVWRVFGDYRAEGLKDTSGAIEAYQHALRLVPNDPDALASLADLKGEMGRDQEALDDYRKVAQLNPRDPDIWNSIASIHYEHRRFAEARAALQHQLDLGKGESHPGIIAEIAMTYLSEGDTDSAAAELAKTTLDARHYRYLRVATFVQLALQKRDYAATIEALKVGMAVPQDVIDYATGYFQLGLLQSCAGDPAGARASFEAVERNLDVARKSGHISPLLPMHLGPAYAALGKADAARESALEGMSQAGDSSDFHPSARTFLAMTLMMIGESDAAVEQLWALQQEVGTAFIVPTPSIAQLKKDCTWDPLRESALFKALLASPPSIVPQSAP